MTRINLRTLAAAVLAGLLSSTLSSDAQTLDKIRELVRSMCVAPDQPGKGWELIADGKGDVSVKLPIAGSVGGGAEVKFTKGEWDGVRKVLTEKASR